MLFRSGSRGEGVRAEVSWSARRGQRHDLRRGAMAISPFPHREFYSNSAHLRLRRDDLEPYPLVIDSHQRFSARPPGARGSPPGQPPPHSTEARTGGGEGVLESRREVLPQAKEKGSGTERKEERH